MKNNRNGSAVRLRDEAAQKMRIFGRLSGNSRLALAAAAFKGSRRSKSVPAQLFLGLTYRCDSACAHCRYRKSDWKITRGDMPSALAVSALKQAGALGITRVVFFGGEPLLYRGLDALIRKASALGFFTELDTNGALLTRPRLKELKEAGLASVMISLHGAEPAGHDRIAGPGAFRRATAAVKLGSSSGLLTYISACVFDGRGQAGMTSRLFTLAKNLGAHGARLLPFAGRSGGADPASNRGILAMTRRAGAAGFARTCLLSAASCDATAGKVAYISPAGTVSPCPYAKHALGSLKTETLDTILAKRMKNGTGIFC